MAPNLRSPILLISLIAVVLVMRQAEVSPGTFLRRQLLGEYTEEKKISDLFCNDVDMSDLTKFSSTKENRAEDFRSNMRDLRGDDTLTDLIERNEPNDTFVKEYVKSMIPLLVPWVVFLGLGVIGCLFYIINWCCMNCYLCKNCCRGVCGTPKTDKFKNFCVVFSLAFMVLTTGAGIAGIVFSTKIPQYANASMCSTVRFIEDIGSGTNEGKWIGIGPGIDRVEELIVKINMIGEGLGIFNDIFNGLAQNVDQTSASLATVYTQNRDATVQRADPVEGTYQPSFIESLGPVSNESTITGMINVELNLKKEGVQEANSTLNSLTTEIKQGVNTIVTDVQAQIPTLRQVSDGIDEALDKLADNRSTIDTVIDVVSGVLLGLFIANTGVACLAIISIVLVCCGAKAFNKSVHLSWCALGLLMLVSWIVSTGLMAATIFLFETCDVGEGIIEDPILFNKTFDRLNTILDINENDYRQTKNIIYRCVHGDGDISEEFNLKSNLVIFEDIFDKVDEYSGLATTTLNRVPESLVLPAQEAVLEKMKTGELPDSELTMVDLVKLNSLTNSNENQCTLLADTWALNSQNCTEGTVFPSGSADDFNVFNPTCIGYNVWTANGNDISNRYTLGEFPQPACGDINNEAEHLYLQAFVNGFVNNRDQTNTLINRLQSNLASVKQRDAKFKQDLNKFPQAVITLNTTVGSIYSSIANENNGLIAATNCKFVVENLEEVLDVACTGLGTSVFQTMIVFLVMSFLTFFGTLMLFCLAKRFTVGKRIKQQKYNVEDPSRQ